MVARQPKTSKEFSTVWQRGISLEALLSGSTEKAEFPDAERRQDRLIGLAVNTMVELYVYEELKKGHTLETLVRTGVVNLPGGEEKKGVDLTFEALEGRVSEIMNMPVSRRNDALFDFVTELVDKHQIRTHRTLVSDGAWDDYKRKRENFHAAREQYEADYASWNEAGAQGDAPRLNMQRPPDPRVETVNKTVKSWITLVDSGPKPEASLLSKLRRKGYKYGSKFQGAAEIMDMSRVLVMPMSPEVETDFLRLLSHHLPEKEYETGKTYPRLFAEPWEVTPYGYFDRKYRVALDRLTESDTTDRSPGLHGMIGEIKVVPKELRQSEKLTAPVYSVLRELDDPNRFSPAGTGEKNRGNFQREREALKSIYDRQKAKYEHACQQAELNTKKEYRELSFPPLPATQLNRSDTYTTLRQELIHLQLRLHTHFLKEAGRDWTHAFLMTAHGQQAEIDDMSTKAGKAIQKQESNENVDAPPPSVNLRQIAANHHLDNDSIRREAYAQWRAEHPRRGRSAALE